VALARGLGVLERFAFAEARRGRTGLVAAFGRGWGCSSLRGRASCSRDRDRHLVGVSGEQLLLFEPQPLILRADAPKLLPQLRIRRHAGGHIPS
jgi:hypothetical protein